MTKLLCKERAKQFKTELKHQNQNRAEQMVQIIKDLTRRIMHANKCRPKYQYYGVEIICNVVNRTSSKNKRGEKVLIEIENRHTPDISRFHYALQNNIEFDSIEESFPIEKWPPGKYLGYTANN